MHAVDRKIRSALSSLEESFFAAIENGSEALTSFDGAWSSFATQVETCVDQLQEDTISRIHSFATSADIVTSTLLEIGSAGDVLHLKLREEITKVLHEDFSHLSIHDKAIPSDTRIHIAYIPLAYQWLLDNLHNPYPAREIRLSISKSTNTPLKDVDSWFIDARKRIGWNQLRKEHFPKRGDLIKAATQFFKPSAVPTPKSLRSTLAADRYLDFAHQFVQMEECAHELYSSKLVPSEFASQLEKAELPTIRNLGQKAELITERGRPGLKVVQRSSYPSPEYSPGRVSRSISPPPSPTLLQSSSHNQHANRKRRRSVSSVDTYSDVEQTEQSVSRVFKRSRYSAADSLPSPAASVDDSLTEELPSSTPVPASPIVSTQPSGKRKRALSDVDDRVQKRPHAIPRSQSLQFSDSIRPAEQLAQMNLEELLVDVFGPNNEYAHGAAPVTSPSFEEINQFGVEFQYDFPYDIMTGNGPDRDESESPGDTPELENIALPKPQLTLPSAVDDMPTFDVENVIIPPYDIHLPWGGFDMPSAAPGAESWFSEQALTNSASMLSSGWPNDCMPIGLESLSPFWSPLGDLSNDVTDYGNSLITSSGTLFSNLTTKTPEQLSYDDKRQKISQLQEMLAKVEVLRSELAL